MSNALTTAKNTAVAGYEDQGVGFEDVDSSDLILPFIKVAQALTPEVDAGDCKSGDLVNTVTGEVYPGDEGFVFQPCHLQTLFVEWEPRADGGAMVAKYEPHDEAVQDAIERNAGSDFGKLTIGDNDLVKTMYVYGLMLDAENGVDTEGFAILSFSQTKLKVVKRWITGMSMLKGKPAIYRNRAVITTQKEKNAHGTFYNFKVGPFAASPLKSLLSPEEHGDTIQAGVDFRHMVLSGAAKAQENTKTDDDTDNEDEIPY